MMGGAPTIGGLRNADGFMEETDKAARAGAPLPALLRKG